MTRLIIIFIMISPLYLLGQKLSISLDLGYGLQFSPDAINAGDVSWTGLKDRRFELVKHSYGEGLNFNAFLEYKVDRYVEVGIGVSYLKGKEQEKHFVSINRIEEISLYRSTMLRIIPEIKLNVPVGKNDVYIRLGFIWGINGKMYHDFFSNDPKKTISYIYAGGDAYGVMSGIGYEYYLSQNMSISSELRIYSQSYGPRERDITSYFKNGKDIVNELTTSERRIDYLDSFIEDKSNIDIDIPTKKLRFFKSFSSLGLNIVINYSF